MSQENRSHYSANNALLPSAAKQKDAPLIEEGLQLQEDVATAYWRL
jgi:hypothetical protein